MAKVLVTEDYLEDIADAIRGKLSSADTYTPGQMAGAIESIPSGGITPTGTINITENGTVDVTQYATANVDVSGGGDDPFSGLKNYIQSSGTQWIDTGYIPKNNSKFVLVAELIPNNNTYSTMFGIRASVYDTSGNIVWVFMKYNGSNNFGYAWDTNVATISTYLNAYSGKKIQITASRGNCSSRTIDGYYLGSAMEPGSYPDKTYSLGLFDLKSADTVGGGTGVSMKLYSFKIYEGDTLLHDFIPWEENNVACLKDTVTGDLKYNAGTGAFTYGTDA